MPGPSYELARCVVCGHADAREIADAEAMRAEVETLWAYQEKRIRPETPPRHLLDRVAFSEHPPLRLVQCVECGLVYRNPTERQRELREIYGRETPAPDVLRSLHETQRDALKVQARELRSVLGRGGSGLEVGSYVGAFLAAARDEGLRIEGLDINAGVNAFTRSLGFQVHDGELTTLETDRTFDAVAIWNTFDQLADPRGAVMAAWRLLRPGGVLALRVPNGAFYVSLRHRALHGAPLARSAARAFLVHNNLLSFPYRWGFTPSALGRLVEEAGFRVSRVRGDVLVPIADRWTRRWARWEERGVKTSLTLLRRMGWTEMPWFEVYASKVTDSLP